MKLLNLNIFRMALLVVLSGLLTTWGNAEVSNGVLDKPSSTPTVQDISWTISGGIEIKDWLVIEESYGTDKPLVNTILKQTTNTIEYSNNMVYIRKHWKLENNALVVEQEIWPVSKAGRRSDLILKMKNIGKIERFYASSWRPKHASPEICNKWITPGQMDRLDGKDGYSNTTFFTILHRANEGVIMDRVMCNGYDTWGGGISDGAGDLSEFTWPMQAYGYWEWNQGHPDGPAEGGNSFLDHIYPPDGGSSQYRLTFFKDVSPEEIGKEGKRVFWQARKEYGERLFPDWEKYHQEPKEKVAFWAFVWNYPTGRVERDGVLWIENLRKMRKILDENGMADSQIYFWVWLYDGDKAGWGEFPLDRRDIKDFFAKIRPIHDVKLGLYVQAWLCNTESKVYKEHPEWFTDEYHTADNGGDAYCGKLPGWGDWVTSHIPSLIKAYDLDLVFLDSADWTTRWRGTHQQAREYFQKLSKVIHENGAIYVANSKVPYVDFGMYENVAGMDFAGDQSMVKSFHQYSFHNSVFGPEFTWSENVRATIEDSGKSILNYFIEHPEFIVRWPVHFEGKKNDRILKDNFTPWVQRRAELLNE